MTPQDEFYKFATKHMGISGMNMHRYNHHIQDMTEFIIEEREMPFRQIDVFSRLIMERIIFIGLPINDYVANVIQAQLLFMESTDPAKDIFMYINTGGGSVYAGLGIYDTMQFIRPDISTICTGLAASMGAVLLTAGTKGKRSSLKHARMMLHQPSGYVGGQASDIRIATNEALKIKQTLYQILSDHTGVPVKTIEKDANRNFWMGSEEAKEYGLIDRVLFRERQEDSQ